MSTEIDDYFMLNSDAVLKLSEPVVFQGRTVDRYDAIERALRDLRDEVIDALERNPRIVMATRAMLDDRLREAMNAINLPENRRG